MVLLSDMQNDVVLRIFLKISLLDNDLNSEMVNMISAPTPRPLAVCKNNTTEQPAF